MGGAFLLSAGIRKEETRGEFIIFEVIKLILKNCIQIDGLERAQYSFYYHYLVSFLC